MGDFEDGEPHPNNEEVVKHHLQALPELRLLTKARSLMNDEKLTFLARMQLHGLHPPLPEIDSIPKEPPEVDEGTCGRCEEEKICVEVGGYGDDPYVSNMLCRGCLIELAVFILKAHG